MANLYGRLQGNRGEVTRCGSQQMDAKVETWQGIVHVRLFPDGTYIVGTSGKHGERRKILVEGNVNTDEVHFAATEVKNAKEKTQP